MDADPLLADVAVAGGGAAGLLAGLAAARAGARTAVLERMRSPGKKIAISGGGRCNYTNTLGPREFIRLFGDPGAPRLGHALRAFSRDDLMALLRPRGIAEVVERGYRLYGSRGQGTEVVAALVDELRAAGAALVTGARVAAVRREPGGGFVLDVESGGAVEECRARALSHTVTPLRPALVGLAVEEPWARGLQGLAWDDAEVTLWPPGGAAGAEGGAEGGAGGEGRRRRPVARERAEVLFAHFGITGPAVIDVSNAYVRSGLARAELRIDFLPDRPREDVDAELVERFRRFPVRGPANALEGLLPARLLGRLAEAAGAAGFVAAQVPRTARQAIADGVKGLALTVTGTRGIEHGEVTAGGIAWEEIDPATLESRLVPGLFFAGEVLDLAGRCGGFNLQAAFSTGYLAGSSAAHLAAADRRP